MTFFKKLLLWKNFKKAFLSFLLIVIPFWFFSYFFSLVFCASDSLPYSGGLLFKGRIPKKGDIIVFWHPHLKQLMMKRLVAIEGESVRLTSHGLKVSEAGIFNIEKLIFHGMLLAPFEGIIPLKMGFIVGDHPRSFDSRYAYYGLIPLERVEGVIIWAF